MKWLLCKQIRLDCDKLNPRVFDFSVYEVPVIAAIVQHLNGRNIGVAHVSRFLPRLVLPSSQSSCSLTSPIASSHHHRRRARMSHQPLPSSYLLEPHTHVHYTQGILSGQPTQRERERQILSLTALARRWMQARCMHIWRVLTLCS
jgi:hypothetical protein